MSFDDDVDRSYGARAYFNMPSIDDPDRDEDYEDCEPLDEQLNRLLRDAAPCDRGMLIILEELDANRT